MTIAAQAAPAPTSVRPRDETRISAEFGKSRVVATLRVRQVSLKSDSAQRPKGRTSNCTYSRIPCSLVETVEIRIDDADVFVPRSATADLSDVNRAHIRELRPGRFELVLNCGDASEAYDAHIVFDRHRVLERTVISGEAGIPSERTIYFDVSKAFKQ